MNEVKYNVNLSKLKENLNDKNASIQFFQIFLEIFCSFKEVKMSYVYHIRILVRSAIVTDISVGLKMLENRNSKTYLLENINHIFPSWLLQKRGKKSKQTVTNSYSFYENVLLECVRPLSVISIGALLFTSFKFFVMHLWSSFNALISVVKINSKLVYATWTFVMIHSYFFMRNK